ncbi:MAG: RNA pseudouridine synthase, partial [Desulfovibrio sp.]|nr:RNA pseudouridine synthase [Desulfovibrio sp.]
RELAEHTEFPVKTRLWNFAELFPLRHVRAPDAPELRLDAALGEALPGSGLRARRRLWASCRISVNGQARAPGHLTRAGDILEAVLLREEQRQEPASGADFSGLRRARSGNIFPLPCAAPERRALRIVARTADYIVFDKASGLHSAHIAGSPHASLERIAREMFTAEDADELHFLTRLDRATSGLVVAALNGRAAARFRRAERSGLTRKSYLAVVQGRLTAPLLLAGRLLTDRRSVTVVLPRNTSDETRSCRVLPLPRRPAGEGLETVSLVRVDIMRGARHQVRAALAAAGFPLCGDALYGGSPCPFRTHYTSEYRCTQECLYTPASPYTLEYPYTPASPCTPGAPVALDDCPPESIPAADGAGCVLKPEGPEFYLHHARLESPELGAQSLPAWAGLFAAPDDLQALLLMPMPDVAAACLP